MANLLDLKGKTFGRLRVLRFVRFNKWHQARWLCRCKCGTKKEISSHLLVRGITTSCGCFHREQHRRASILKSRLRPGQRYGRLVVLGRSNIMFNGRSIWHCLCDCGNRTAVLSVGSLGKSINSCGCLRSGPTSWKWKDGRTSLYMREYRSWYCMTHRCLNPKNHAYEDYGGRGIKVCERWQGRQGFLNFLDDMGPRPQGKTLDRKNVMGNYEPGNCQWADAKTQVANRRTGKTPEQLVELKRLAEEDSFSDYGESAY